MQTGAATMENSVEFLKKLKIDLPQYPALFLWGTNTEDTVSYYRDTCPSTFTVALFIVAKCKQPRYISTDKWTMKLWHIYTRLLFSCREK